MLLPELPLELPPIEDPPDELPELPPIDEPPDGVPDEVPELPPIDDPPVELPEVPPEVPPGELLDELPGVLDVPAPGVGVLPPVVPLVPPDVPPPAGGGVVLLVPESLAPGDAPGEDLLVDELVPPCSELVVPLLPPPRLQAARLTVSNPRRISIFEVPRLDLITIPFKSGCADYWLDWDMLHKFQRLASGSASQQTRTTGIPTDGYSRVSLSDRDSEAANNKVFEIGQCLSQ